MRKIRDMIQKILGDKELIRYVIIGVLTTVVNYGVYWLFTRLAGTEELTANWIAWAASVAFAFVTNKLYVFRSRNVGVKGLLAEIFNFVLARVVSLGADQAMIWLLVIQLGWYDMLCKVLSNVVVLILNYAFSKCVVFRKK